MELTQAVSERRSIRTFKNSDVPNDMIMSILETARLAPSAKNRQPWKFYIAKGDLKNSITQIMRDYQKRNPNEITSILSTTKAIDEAPVLILIFKDSNNQFERSDTLSIGGMIQTMLLKATELGLGSLWICDTAYVRDEISKLVASPLELYSAVAIGEPNESPTARPRKSLEEILIK